MSYQKPWIEQTATMVRPSRPASMRRARPVRVVSDSIPAKMLPILRATGGTYLGEDESFYYWMEPGATDQLGGFFDKIGNVFKKIPKAFAPKNLYKTFIDTTLTVASGGLYLAAPKKLRSQIRGVANYAVPAIAGGVLAYTAGPAVWGMLQPKLMSAGKLLSGFGSKLFGSTKSAPGVAGSEGLVGKALSVGGKLFDFMGRLPQHQQAEVAERLTPEDIAYMEKYQQIPPHLKGFFDNLATQERNYQQGVGGTGAGSLYPGMTPEEGAPVQAGMFGELNMTTVLLFAVPAAFFLLSGQAKGARR